MENSRYHMLKSLPNANIITDKHTYISDMLMFLLKKKKHIHVILIQTISQSKIEKYYTTDLFS